MKKSEEATIRDAEQNEQKVKELKRLERKSMMIQEMRASGSFMRLVTLIKYKWFDMVLLMGVLIVLGSVLGVVARILWEVWQTTFSINL